MKPTSEQIAADFNLWQEYVDPLATMSIDDFQALTVEKKLTMMLEIWGPDSDDDLTR